MDVQLQGRLGQYGATVALEVRDAVGLQAIVQRTVVAGIG